MVVVLVHGCTFSHIMIPLLCMVDPPGGSSDEGGGQARSTADDVCPWDSGPPRALAPEPTSQVGRTSRKNSSQLDSGGSSSDISIAIAESHLTN
ncbi:hypothetical protein FOCC_FOCC005681 [Frankliniella occidentalis]|nr:hypothetical protein FOCC_FOCC005681 [Frankliniella occidentalis]